MSRVLRCLALAAVVSLAAADPAAATLRIRDGWMKAYVNTASTDHLTLLMAASGSELIWAYTNEGKALVYTPSLPTLAARANDMSLTATAANDIPATVVLQGRTLDAIPAEDDFRFYDSTDPGLYLLRFAGKIDPQWEKTLQGLGVILAQRADGKNAGVFIATPQNIARANAFDWVEVRDFFHPRWKRSGVAVVEDRYYAAEFAVAPNAPDASRIARDLERPAVAQGDDGDCYRGEDVVAIWSHPLVLTVEVGRSKVEIFGVYPPQATRGEPITIWTSGDVDEVRVGPTAASFTKLENGEIRVTVPFGLVDGPNDLVVRRSDGWRQVLQAGNGRGFRIGPRNEVTFARGDLLLSTNVPKTNASAEPGRPFWYTQAGELRRERNETLWTLFFGPEGFLHGFGDEESYRFDARLDPATTGVDYLAEARAVTIARDGTAFVSIGDELHRYSASGEKQDEAQLPKILSLDLFADQCTLAVATDASLVLYDGCAMRSVRSLRSGKHFVARILPDDSILAGDAKGSLIRVDRNGKELAKLPVTVRAMAIEPDARFAWVVIDGKVQQYDFITRELSAPVELLGMIDPIQSLTVYGEWTAARGAASYDEPMAIERVTNFDAVAGATVTVTGHGWLPSATITIGGIPVTNATIGTTTITFPKPAGTLTTRELVVKNPNGQRAVFSLPRGKRRAA